VNVRISHACYMTCKIHWFHLIFAETSTSTSTYYAMRAQHLQDSLLKRSCINQYQCLRITTDFINKRWNRIMVKINRTVEFKLIRDTLALHEVVFQQL